MSISYQSLDLETESLVASLILQDLEEIQDARKGKSRAEAPITDDQLALQDQLAAVMSHLTVLEDIRVAHSLDDALRLDAGYLEALSIINQAEIEDRNAALALHRGDALPPPTASQRAMENPLTLASMSVSSFITQPLSDDICAGIRQQKRPTFPTLSHLLLLIVMLNHLSLLLSQNPAHPSGMPHYPFTRLCKLTIIFS